MRIIVISLIAMILFSCNPQKRLSRLIRKHPELFQTDTINSFEDKQTDPINIDSIFEIQTLLPGSPIPDSVPIIYSDSFIVIRARILPEITPNAGDKPGRNLSKTSKLQLSTEVRPVKYQSKSQVINKIQVQKENKIIPVLKWFTLMVLIILLLFFIVRNFFK